MSSAKKSKNDNKDRFATTTDREKEQILRDTKSKNTNKATKSHIKLFMEYLLAKDKPKMQDIADEGMLSDFYSNVRT